MHGSTGCGDRNARLGLSLLSLGQRALGLTRNSSPSPNLVSGVLAEEEGKKEQLQNDRSSRAFGHLWPTLSPPETAFQGSYLLLTDYQPGHAENHSGWVGGSNCRLYVGLTPKDIGGPTRETQRKQSRGARHAAPPRGAHY